jgi:hypothetical protein
VYARSGARRREAEHRVPPGLQPAAAVDGKRGPGGNGVHPGCPAYQQKNRAPDYPGVARALGVTLTGNQPHALEAARRADGRERRLGWRSVRSGTGEPDRRSIRTAPADDSRFPGARQVFRIRRGVGDLDNLWTTKEIVYGIASLLASPEHLWLLRTATLDRGKTSPLDPRCDLPRELSPAQDQYRSSSSRQLPQLGALAGRANIANARRDLHSHDDVVTVYASNPQQSNRTKITTPEPWLRLG